MIDNRDTRAPPDHVVKLDQVSGAHTDATVTSRQTNIPLLRSAVNVDVATKCVRILPFEPAQPNDSRYDRIASGRVDADNLTGSPAIFKNSAGRHTVADFLRDLQFAERGAITSSPVADAVFGSRNRINRDRRFAIKQREFLILHADDDIAALPLDAPVEVEIVVEVAD